MSLYAIADLHLSLGTDKPMDIFGGWDNYIERLDKNWRSTVKSEDTVVIAGDISWAMRLEQTFKDFSFIESLPGRKIFLKGNHDYWWTTRKKIEAYLKENNFKSISILFNSAEVVENFAVCGTRGWSYDCSTQEDVKILNREVGRLTMSIEQARKLDREVIVFLHYPPVFSGYECTEIINVLREYKIKKCYYGHLHGASHKDAVEGIVEGIKLKLISGDYLKFKLEKIDN
mgnify:FL=1